MPTEEQITEMKVEVLRFVDEIRRASSSETFGTDEQGIRFNLGFVGQQDRVTLDLIRTHDQWRCRGLFTFLLAYLESLHGMVTVSIRCARSQDIQPILRKRGYVEYPDSDFVKHISPDCRKSDLNRLPKRQ